MDDDVEDDRRALDRQRDAQLVARLRAGDERAFGEIYDAWFDRVHDLAGRIVRDPARAADVAQDTFLAAWRRLDTLADPASLGGWLLRICRNRALNVIEKEQRAVAVDDTAFGVLEAAGAPVNAPDGFRVAAVAGEGDPARAVEDAEVVELLWRAADALGERDRTVLDLHLRHGLTPAEIGEVVGVNRNAANQLVHRVKGRLEGAVRARVLWRADGPACAELQRALEDAGVERFDSRAVTIANRHADRCDRCGDDRHRRLQPAALFGAVPIAVAPFAVKQQAAAALARQGVPMAGSQAAPGSLPDAGGEGGPGANGPTAPTAHTSAPPAGDVTGAGAGTLGERALAGDARSGARRRRRRALTAAAVVLALVLAVVGVGLVAGDDGDPEALRTEAEPGAEERGEVVERGGSVPAGDRDGAREVRGGRRATTSTTGPVGTEAPEPAGPDPTVPPGGGTTVPPLAPAPGDPPGAPPPADAPPLQTPPDQGPGPDPTTTTTRPRPTATARITITPAQMSVPVWNPFPGTPVLEWSATGGSQVSVTGPGFTSAARTSPAGGVYLCPDPPAPNWTTCVPGGGEYTYAIEVRDADGTLLVRKEATLRVA